MGSVKLSPVIFSLLLVAHIWKHFLKLLKSSWWKNWHMTKHGPSVPRRQQYNMWARFHQIPWASLSWPLYFILILFVYGCVYVHIHVQISMSLWTLESEDGIGSFIAEVTGICRTLHSSCRCWDLNSVPHDCVAITLNPWGSLQSSVMIWIGNISQGLTHCACLPASRCWRTDSILKSLI